MEVVRVVPTLFGLETAAGAALLIRMEDGMGLSPWIGGVCVASARWVRGQGLPSKLRADSLARWAEEREVVAWLVGRE